MHIMDTIEITDVERRLVNGMQMGRMYDSKHAVNPSSLHFHDIEGFPQGVKVAVLEKLVCAGYLDYYGDAGWMKAKEAENNPPADIHDAVINALSERFDLPTVQHFWRAGDKFHCVLTDDACRILCVTASRSKNGVRVALDNIALDYAPHGNDPFANQVN
jgi:hypothetical protein